MGAEGGAGCKGISQQIGSAEHRQSTGRPWTVYRCRLCSPVSPHSSRQPQADSRPPVAHSRMPRWLPATRPGRSHTQTELAHPASEAAWCRAGDEHPSCSSGQTDARTTTPRGWRSPPALRAPKLMPWPCRWPPASRTVRRRDVPTAPLLPTRDLPHPTLADAGGHVVMAEPGTDF